MNTKVCSECGHSYPASRNACPNCGVTSAQLERSNVKRLGWLVVALAIGGLGVMAARRTGVLPAQPAPVAQAATHDDSYCQIAGGLASEIMTGRQSGRDMAQMLAATKGEASRYMVVSAFEQPRYRTEEAQTRAIQEFKNAMFLECVKAQGKGR